MCRLLLARSLLLVGCCVAVLGASTVETGDLLGDADADSDDGTPVLLRQPDVVNYIVKGKPVTLTCEASSAVLINFKCVDHWMRPEEQLTQPVVDAITGATYLRTSIEVSRHHVEEYGADAAYMCWCHAWNRGAGEPRSTMSRKARVQVAYLRKRFERAPLSIAVEIDSPVQLQCLPPDGLPQPKVFWQKNGVTIDIDSQVNYIKSSEGNLIIGHARLKDMGNYSCGASNVASRRISDAAKVTVYINGKWSTWGQWTECNSRCGHGLRRRTRTCTHPVPRNGGASCRGDGKEEEVCTTSCPVNGLWSTWSSWSTCGPDCKHHRRRICDNPAPRNGGNFCPGNDLTTYNCTGSMCQVTSEVPRESVAMYISLISAIGVFIIVIIIITVVLHRKKRSRDGDEKKLNKAARDLMSGQQPDLTQTIGHQMALNNAAASSANNNAAAAAMYGGGGGGGGGSDSVDKIDNAINMSKSQQLALKVAHGSRPTSAYSGCHDNRWSDGMPADTLVWAKVTHTGARLSLRESGVNLVVPEGAIAVGCSEDIFLAVSRDDNDRPKLSERQTLLSPVIMVGPQRRGVSLKKPLILSFQHSASIKHGQWSLAIHTSDHSEDEPTNWQHLVTLGSETINTPVYVQLEASECFVMTEGLVSYALIGEPALGGRAVKSLRLAAFAPAGPASTDYGLRVYCVDDDRHTIQGVLQQEARMGGRLLGEPTPFLFQHAADNLCFSVEQLLPGWRCKMNANYQEIPFQHIWSGTQSGIHCSFALEHTDRSQRRLAASIHVFQKGLVANQQVLDIECDLEEKSAGCVPVTPTKKSVTVSADGDSCSSLASRTNVFRLPQPIKSSLCQILDPPNSRGNDWRMLAQRLSVDRYINYFATKTSPTEHILDLWDARHQDEASLTDLMNSLRVMGRQDAAAIIEKEMGAWL